MIVRRQVTAAALALSVLALPLAASAQGAAPTAKIKQGALAGAMVEGVEEFWGIPYAAPPVGDLRWKPPTAAASWTGERDATKAGATCQPTQKGEYTEDCLFANVTRPAGRASLARSCRSMSGSMAAASPSARRSAPSGPRPTASSSPRKGSSPSRSATDWAAPAGSPTRRSARKVPAATTATWTRSRR